MKKQIGLFFGSFNPIHIGHLIIANHLVEHSAMNELWFVVTPQNPFRKTIAIRQLLTIGNGKFSNR